MDIIDEKHFPKPLVDILKNIDKLVHHPQKHFFLPAILAKEQLDNIHTHPLNDNSINKEEVDYNFSLLLSYWHLAITDKLITYCLRGSNKHLTEILLKYHSVELKAMDESIAAKAYELKEKSRVIAEDEYRKRQSQMIDAIRDLVEHQQ